MVVSERVHKSLRKWIRKCVRSKTNNQVRALSWRQNISDLWYIAMYYATLVELGNRYIYISVLPTCCNFSPHEQILSILYANTRAARKQRTERESGLPEVPVNLQVLFNRYKMMMKSLHSSMSCSAISSYATDSSVIFSLGKRDCITNLQTTGRALERSPCGPGTQQVCHRYLVLLCLPKSTQERHSRLRRHQNKSETKTSECR